MAKATRPRSRSSFLAIVNRVSSRFKPRVFVSLKRVSMAHLFLYTARARCADRFETTISSSPPLMRFAEKLNHVASPDLLLPKQALKSRLPRQVRSNLLRFCAFPSCVVTIWLPLTLIAKGMLFLWRKSNHWVPINSRSANKQVLDGGCIKYG